ncbi:DUF724 domain-containing protein 3 [Cocos nucifera]|uniref:DUF724 domain-containing protein 3 n=1 Tax=Cocos nucifera TaxID=13894 RepID=A0A8K0NDU8_COCNU|nr:DUF724 domain-containing protein 3 [Cocos nucifera]
MAAAGFMTGDAVEVSSEDDGFRDAWFEAKVARYMPKLHRYTVVYDNIMDDADESRPLRETVDGRLVRPRYPSRPPAGGRFVLHQPVDAFYNDGWWVGVVSRVAEKGRQRRYSVAFPSTREEMEFAASELRIHLEWVDGEWVLPEFQETPEKIYETGTQVEVARVKGNTPIAWLSAVVVKAIWKSSFLVEYKHFMNLDDTELLREIVDAKHVRPCPPHASKVKFDLLDEVEAFYGNGWLPGVVAKIHTRSKYRVKIAHWGEEREFSHAELRLRYDLVDGQWVKASENKSDMELREGTMVEVSSDDEGFRGAWYAATIVKLIQKKKFLVEYKNLKTDDETKPLTEIVDFQHIRPSPETSVIKQFKLLEEVDAFYNDGWWVGVISKVLKGQRYMVYFKPWSEELEFGHKELRLHHDWIGGRWLRSSEWDFTSLRFGIEMANLAIALSI